MKTKILISFLIIFSFTINICSSQNDLIHVTEPINDSVNNLIIKSSSGDIYYNGIIPTEIHNEMIDYSYIESQHISFGNDIFEENIDLPNEIAGILPLDVIYNSNNDKYYIYGGRKIVIANASDNQVSNSIIVSETGILNSFTPNTSTFPVEHNLAFNESDNILYCTNESHELIIIDCYNDEILEIKEFPAQTYNSSVIYNSILNKVYWIGNTSPTELNRIIAYNGTNFQYCCEFTTTYNNINDVLITPDGDKLFVSSKNYLFLLNAGNLSLIDNFTLSSDHTFGVLSYNNNLNKLYCQRYNEAIISVFNISNNTINYIGDIQSIPITRGYRACYNSYFDFVYYVGKNINYAEFNLVIIDCSNDELLNSYVIPYVTDVIYNNTNHLVYCAGSIIKSFNGQILIAEQSIDGYITSIALNNSDNGILCTNTEGGSLELFNEDLSGNINIQLGGYIISGCLNTIQNKLYWTHYKSDNNESFLSITNLETNDVTIITIGPYITSCAYNPSNNKVFVGNRHWSQRGIAIIDGVSDQLEQTIPLDYGPDIIFSGHNNNVYIGCGNQFYLMDASNYNITSLQLPIPVPYWIVDIEEDKENNRLFVLTGSTLLDGNKLLVIDQISNTIIGECGLSEKPKDICFNNINNKIYALCNESQIVYVIDGNSYSVIDWILPYGIGFYLEYSNRQNKLYIIGCDIFEPTFLKVYDGNTNSLIKEIILNKPCTAIKYNNHNDRLYLHVFPYILGERENRLLALDCKNDNFVSDIYLNQKIKSSNQRYNIYEEIIQNPTGENIYIGNHGLSHYSIISCAPDHLPLRSGWTWISYPRLERDGNDPVYAPDVLGNINQDYSYLKMTNIPPQQIDEIFIEWNGTQWITSGGLEYVQSTKGYKLYIEPEGVRTISLYGTVLDPSTQMNLYAGYANWIGFFPEQTITVSDAFSSIWSNISVIRHQDWAIANPSGNQPPVPDYMLNFTLTYGDMVIVRVWEDCTFQWPSNSDPETPLSAPETNYFSYEEKADYTPFFVEMNPDSIPVEIAVYEDTTCIGASVVQDSVVEINGYLTDSAGYNPEISFVSYYAARSAPKEIKKYHVYNFEKGKMERRTIHSKDKADYYWISLKGGNAYEDEEIETSGDIEFKVYPNPFSNQTNFIYELKKPTKVRLYIYDTKGMRITTLIDGNQTSGIYKLAWNGKNDSGKTLQPGIYYYNFFANGLNKNGKLIIIE